MQSKRTRADMIKIARLQADFFHCPMMPVFMRFFAPVEQLERFNRATYWGQSRNQRKAFAKFAAKKKREACRNRQ